MLNKLHIYFSIVLCLLCVTCLGGCGVFSELKDSISLSSDDGKNELRELAYNVYPKRGYTVYLKEVDAYVPYLVVSSNYGGNVLLLRRELLEKAMPFNENERHMWAGYENGAYYEKSSIDKYLNKEFINLFSQSLQDLIVNSEIIITDESSLGISGDKSTKISRKIFLLSLIELNGAESSVSVPEGDTLKYFDDDYERRVAYMPNGMKSPYWTRTPQTWETYDVFTIGTKGTGMGTADIDSGVRPAFCLNGSTLIKQRSDIISGQTVYVIE